MTVSTTDDVDKRMSRGVQSFGQGGFNV